MMMTSQPYFMLMQPNTLEIINKIWEYRKETGRHVCFTLDAGANVHVLYPESEKTPVYQFIRESLLQHCENGHHICDRIGFGAKEIIKNEE
jgi:diphosphomevalonate decarboxylase